MFTSAAPDDTWRNHNLKHPDFNKEVFPLMFVLWDEWVTDRSDRSTRGGRVRMCREFDLVHTCSCLRARKTPAVLHSAWRLSWQHTEEEGVLEYPHTMKKPLCLLFALHDRGQSSPQVGLNIPCGWRRGRQLARRKGHTVDLWTHRTGHIGFPRPLGRHGK